MRKIIVLFVSVFLLFGVVLINSCKKETTIPTLTTTTQTNVTITSATSGGVITKDGGEAVTARGVCWGTAANPTVSGSKTTDGTGTGTFTSSITGLTANTLYYVRAYATNSVGTAYGNEITFTTSPVLVATLTTTAVTSITLTTAASGGNITADGGGAITARGVCWATTTAPTIAGSKTSDATGLGVFTSSLTGLLPGTAYFLRAYATNSAGTAYGNEVTFTTSPVVVATVTTTAVTAVTLTTAVSGGNVTSDGGSAVTAKGICWATTTNPTIAGSKTTDGTGTGIFVSNLTNLLPGTTYFVKAYATNSIGTAYGSEVSFTTSPVVVPTLTTTAVTSITLTTAISGGNITADGGATVTARGVCWATTADPTITGSKTSDATGTGIFTSNLTGLVPGTTYHVRAYATNSAGTAYGSDISFVTTPIVVPTVTTTAVTPIALTTAVSGGNVTADGGGAVTARGVCWSTSANPTITGSKTTDGTGTGIFVSNMTSLLPATTYHVRAYATNSAGTAYGSDITFTTTSIGVPTLTTTAATTIGLTTAVSGGNVTADGGAAVTARGTCWATTADPTILNSKTSDGTGTGIFVSNLTALLPNTTYHARAYATNSAGTAYGSDITFTTNAVAIPTLTTTVVSSITLTTAVSGGNITADGGSAVTARGVCWAITANPTIASAKTTDGPGTGIFVSNLTVLLPGTTYHVRAYATNSAGTAYGADLTFTTTSVVVPTLTTTAVTAITATTAASGGTITADGGAAITARGVCWATTTAPTILSSVTSNGTGTGSFVSNLTALLPGTTYYVRSYATNSAGTAYGNEITFATTAATPTLTTTAVTGITISTATSGGNITDDGGGAVTARGVCWAITASPTIANSTTSNGTGTGIFPSNLTGLTSGTTYYVRAYATNSAGTAYGNQQTFRTTNETGTVSDVDGNTYATVRIGTQWWMAENLKTTLYNNSTPIPNVTSNTIWSTLSTAAYCWFNNDGTTYKPWYGAMYNWFAVATGNLCPTGWHVPTDGEYATLELFLGMTQLQVDTYGWRGIDQGTQLKNTSGWTSNGNGTNTSGWTALPGGYRWAADGSFNDLTNLSYWWTSTEDAATTAWYRRLDATNVGVYKAVTERRAGKYVRCIQD
jgi:uncharacterized protein (TIGR02145 family)